MRVGASARNIKENEMSFGPTELILILAIVLIIFGAGKLPQVLGSLGKGVKEFREASENTTGNSATTTNTVQSTTTAPSQPGMTANAPNRSNAETTTAATTAPNDQQNVTR